MRFLYLLFLIVFLAAVGMFAYQNQQEITLNFWDQSLTGSVPLIVGAVFLLGMLSGWTIIGMLRRSVDRVLEPQEQR